MKPEATTRRTLALAIGNSAVSGGVFAGGRLVRRLRIPLAAAANGRLFGREPASRAGGGIDAAVLCSVVPALTRAVGRRVREGWGIAPLILSPGAPHGLGIGYRKPGQLGADRIAAALGARAAFPGRNVIIVDCGTATTVTALSREGVILGGAILPGAGLWPGMLASATARLARIAPRRPRTALGRSTAGGLRSGIHHGHAGAIRELVGLMRAAAFGRGRATVVGTGGHAARFSRDGLFAAVKPDLVLRGLLLYSKLVHDRR